MVGDSLDNVVGVKRLRSGRVNPNEREVMADFPKLPATENSMMVRETGSYDPNRILVAASYDSQHSRVNQKLASYFHGVILKMLNHKMFLYSCFALEVIRITVFFFKLRAFVTKF